MDKGQPGNFLPALGMVPKVVLPRQLRALRIESGSGVGRLRSGIGCMLSLWKQLQVGRICRTRVYPPRTRERRLVRVTSFRVSGQVLRVRRPRVLGLRLSECRVVRFPIPCRLQPACLPGVSAFRFSQVHSERASRLCPFKRRVVPFRHFQQRNGLRVISQLRNFHRRLRLRPLDRDVRARCKELFDNFAMSVHHRHEQRCCAIRCANVDIGSRGGKQERDHQRVPLVRRMHQRGAALGVARVHVRPGRERRLQTVDVARLRRAVQGIGAHGGAGTRRCSVGFDAAPFGGSAQGTQRLGSEFVRGGQTGVVEECAVGRSGAGAPDTIGRPRAVPERGQQRLRLANRPRRGRSRIGG